MDTAGIFHSADSRTGYSDLWEITWERIVCFLPHLREELFKQTVIPGTEQEDSQHLIFSIIFTALSFADKDDFHSSVIWQFKKIYLHEYLDCF